LDNQTLHVASHTHTTIDSNTLMGIHEINVESYAHVIIILTSVLDAVRTYQIKVGHHASVRLCIVVNSVSAQLNFNFELDDYAQVDLKGMYIVKDKQRVDIATMQHHKGIASSSSILLKGILYDYATADYKGTIIIDDSAPQSQAEQYNKNLIMSENARATSIPSLEVLTDNVRCKHGAAVGQLSQDHLLYLQSRGIELEQAKSLLIDAFFAEVVNEMHKVSNG